MFYSLALFLATGLSGGLTGGIVKILVLKTPPMTTIMVRIFVGTIILSLLFLRKQLIKEALKNKYLLLSGLLLTMNIYLYTFGVQYTSLIMGQLLYVPTALVVAVIGYLFLKEKLDGSQVLGLIMALIGMAVLFWGSIQTSDILSFGTPLGNIIIGIAMFSWAFYTVISRKLSNKYKPMEIVTVNFLFAFFSSILVFVIMKLFGIGNTRVSFDNLETNILLVSVALVAVLFLIFYQQLIKKTSAFTSSLVTYINPVFATFFGAIFLKEHLTPSLVVGGLIVIVAVFYTTSYKYIKK